MPADRIEHELFGHEQVNASNTKREGCFELARGGTIFLDEIHHISAITQGQLLRVLQEREVQLVGSKRPINVDVRIIATTNRALEQSVERKTFRQDLYFRLNVLPLLVPPLRERLEDIPILAEAFMRLFSRKHGTQIQNVSIQAKAALSQHHWPGNVRELRNVIEGGVIFAGNTHTLEVEHLMLPNASPALTEFVAQTSTATTGTSFASLAELEKQHILAALERCKGNRTHAARLLDISIRTLRNKLHEYNGTTPKASGRSGSTPSV